MSQIKLRLSLARSVQVSHWPKDNNFIKMDENLAPNVGNMIAGAVESLGKMANLKDLAILITFEDGDD